MKQPRPIITSQEGAALIIVMLVLIAVTAVGLTAINISTTEINLAGNDKWQKVGFYNGDPGLHGAPPVIYPNLNPEVDAPLPEADPGNLADKRCLNYINFVADGPTEFHDLLYGAKRDPEPNQPDTKDISFRACDINADIDVCPRGSSAISGGGIEFASRAEGLGASGSEGKLYLITSTGDGAQNTYTVQGHYRWVEASGGLK